MNAPERIYPLKWVTVKDGVVTEHEREETYSSNWERAFGKPYAPEAEIEALRAERDALAARVERALTQIEARKYELSKYPDSIHVGYNEGLDDALVTLRAALSKEG